MAWPGACVKASETSRWDSPDMEDALNDVDDAKVGETVLVRVVKSPTRTTYFPDQTIVVSTGVEMVDVVLLRQEIAVKSQRGTVQAVSEDAVQIDFQPHELGWDMMDVAHVRFKTKPALDMAITIINQAIENGTVTREQAMNRLLSEAVDIK